MKIFLHPKLIYLQKNSIKFFLFHKIGTPNQIQFWTTKPNKSKSTKAIPN